MLLDSWTSPVRTCITRAGLFGRIFFEPPTLMAGSSAVLWPTKTHSTSLERSKPPLLIQTLSKSLAALLMYFISFQSTLISIGFISKGAVFVGPICMVDSCFLLLWQHFTNFWPMRKKIVGSRSDRHKLLFSLEREQIADKKICKVSALATTSQL